jgi:hypothetical protein
MDEETECERQETDIKYTVNDLKKEKSQHITKMHCANRDGDLYYINCPDCKCTDLKERTVLMCKNCGTHFNLYFEDGHKELLVRDYSEQTDKRLVIGTFDDDGDYFQEWYIITPKIESYNLPFKKKKALYKDLQDNGKDGHGHHKYKRYALIPLGEVEDKEPKHFIENKKVN